ncbi:putative FRIGIDA-like protein 1 [Cinnamomum micranthum f. kanehirae]|uniref:FRIGIDA-like protein n=1 Tax=Cinnamomum micranthum f. kanehirae TaxID=337451 RepID=A0A3S3QE55_9MAGN|nr:putative FRIGIDA-like protein 1 [Cinnamomum micranthum f. kanehirae]
MASLQSISAAIEAIPSKKEKLRKTFEDLRSHSACIAAFDLQWKDLEDHLDAIEKAIEKRFKDLESAERQQQQPAAAAAPPAVDSQPPSDLVIYPQLKTFCSKMDGKRLVSFILAHRKDGVDIKDELDDALRSAPDPAKLVLDSMKGFYPPRKKGGKDAELAALRRACILLLERLAAMAPLIKESERERAKELALEWKEMVYEGDDSLLEGMGFFQLLATFGLVSEFEIDDLLEMLSVIARRRQTIELCKALGLTNKVPDLIKKLINKSKQLDAVKFIYAFELVDKFPPIPLLNAYLKEAQRMAQVVRKRGNNSAQSLYEAATKEITSIRAIIKSVEDHNLQSEYSCEHLEKRIASLEKQKSDKRRYQQSSHQQYTNKRQKPASTTQAASTLDNGSPSLPHSSPQPSGLLSDHVNPYSGSAKLYALAGGSGSGSGPAGLFGLVSGTGAAPVSSAPHAHPGSSGLYGLTGGPGALHDPLYDRPLGSSLYGAHLSYGGNRTPPRSHFHAEALSSSLYDKPMGYGGYPVGLPPSFRPTFYP